MSVVEVTRGASSVILAFPHTGTEMPDAIWDRLNENGRLLADTDWHVHKLYDGLARDVTRVRATFHRYVIDANRDPAGGSLYPGQNTTGLVPMTDFDGQPIWREGQEPTAEEVTARLTGFHAPYHAALAAEIGRVKATHGVALLYDCHSIRSRIPFLFDGTLPDYNVGTNDGRSCSSLMEREVIKILRTWRSHTSVLNGRFKGGWTTRRYGQPEQGVHAVQMELAQSTYLETEAPPFAYDPVKAKVISLRLQIVLERSEFIAVHGK